jgi:hypothetical protein
MMVPNPAPKKPMFTKYIYHTKGTPANLAGIMDDALDAKRAIERAIRGANAAG